MAKPYLQLTYPLRGFHDSEDPHAWGRFRWARCFDAPVSGKEAAECDKRGGCPLHGKVQIKDTKYKYCEIVVDDRGIFVFVSPNEIDEIDDQRRTTHYFLGRKSNEKRRHLQNKIDDIIREMRGTLEVDALANYGFEVRPATSK